MIDRMIERGTSLAHHRCTQKAQSAIVSPCCMAKVAQLVERQIVVLMVAGSIPVFRPIIFFKR